MGSFWHSKRTDNKRCTVEVRWGFFFWGFGHIFFLFLRAVVNIPRQTHNIVVIWAISWLDVSSIKYRKPRGWNISGCHRDSLGVVQIGWFHFTKEPNFPLIENRKPRGYNLLDCHYDCMGVFFSNKTASLQFSFAHRYYSWSKKALCKPQTNKNMQCGWVPIQTVTLGTSRLERCLHHRLQNLKFN